MWYLCMLSEFTISHGPHRLQGVHCTLTRSWHSLLSADSLWCVSGLLVGMIIWYNLCYNCSPVAAGVELCTACLRPPSSASSLPLPSPPRVPAGAAWALALLATHPEAQSRLVAELDAAELLATPQRPQPRPFVFEDCSRLRYLAAVIQEALRYRGCSVYSLYVTVRPESGDAVLQYVHCLTAAGITLVCAIHVLLDVYSTQHIDHPYSLVIMKALPS